MSVTLSTISTQVDQFNDIPDISFTGIDITEFVEEVEIYTNTPAVMIPTKLNAMAANMKTWLNSNVTTPLENQQNTFKDEVVVRTNTAMNAVETYMNDEVAAFVNTVFVPWANTAGTELSTASNLLEANVTTQMSQLQTDYTIHVQNQDAIIQQAIADMITQLAQYTTGAANSGYSIHQTNLLMGDLTMTREIGFDDFMYTKDDQISFAEEGINTTHHIAYDRLGGISSFGESMLISGEPRPFYQHLRLQNEAATGSTSIEKIKAYNIFKSVSQTNINSFRATAHEADGTPGVDLTILNNTSIADVDNPELILRRGSSNALMFDGIDDGDLIKISTLAGAIYNTGVEGQYAEDYETIMFTPSSSYCHDANSSVTGWGVTADMNASGIDSDGGDFETPLLCENYATAAVALLDDFSRTYETQVSGESYDADLSDGLTYVVEITDDTGVVDTYSYTIDANTTLGTGAIINAIYDDGVSDVTITNAGSKYSESTFARAFDLGAVDVAGSSETKAEATFTLRDGMIDSVAVMAPGTGYVGYWNIALMDNGNGHVHNLQLTQAEINLVKTGTSVVSTTIEAGHSHDITVSWNAFTEKFEFARDPADAHDHGPVEDSHTINPSITVGFTTSTGSGAAGYVLLNESDELDKVIITAGGSLYVIGDAVTISGGGESVSGAVQHTIADGGVDAVSVTNQGTGYTDTTAKTVSVAIQNNAFAPSEITANVGDSIAFTNLDIGAHTVQSAAFDSGDIPQNAVFTYVVTQDTELTRKYEITDSYSGAGANLWVRENTVYVDVETSTGGGMRGVATVNASGNIIDIAVDRPGKGYVATDVVKPIDVSGTGEGAYADVVTNRSINTVTVDTAGSGYSQDTEIFIYDPTGTPILDVGGAEIGRTYGSNASVKGVIALVTVPAFCSLSQYTDQSTCESNAGTWTLEVPQGAITEVTVTRAGSNYVDVDIIINDPTGLGAGAVLSTDIHNTVTDITMTARGTSYDEPIVRVIDPKGTVGSNAGNTVGAGFVGTVELNNGIGDVSITEDWHDYINGQTRIVVLDAHAEPTGYGATGVAALGGAGNVSNIEISNPGSAYKTPVVIVAGPVQYTGGSINAAATDYALYGPEGNTNSSPFSSSNTAGTSFKNGILVQWGAYQGHSLNDKWTFTLQSWKKGTPDSLVYESSRYNGAANDMRGVITLKDVWDV